jgi:dihydroorotase
VHLQRISSAAGVALLKAAKAEGLPVTADVSMHSLFLVDNDIGYFDSRMRLAPPLRQSRDRQALRDALLSGIIDAVVSDHTPVSEDGKSLPFAEAEVGATGLELLLNMTLRLGQEQRITVSQALNYVTLRAAAILGKPTLGHLSVGGQADVTVFDPRQLWTLKPDQLLSQGKQTPFSGFELEGKVTATVVNGFLAYQAHRAKQAE